MKSTKALSFARAFPLSTDSRAMVNRELYEICVGRLGEVESVLIALLEWARDHPDSVDGEL